MKKIILSVGLVFCLVAATDAQQKYPLGLVLDDEDYLETSHASPNIQIESGQKSIPRDVDLTRFAPEVRNQGDISSCVGWSAGYAAMTIERAIANGWTNKREITENATSALFVYNQLANGDCQGVRMPRALQLMQEQGNCLAKDFDFDINDCGVEVPSDLITKAKNHRIEDYIRLFDPKEEPEEKVRNIRLVLSQNKPVVIGMKVLNNFYDIQQGDISWIPTVGDVTYAGGHAMVVVGYDDDRFDRGESADAPEMRGAFKIMNSWGKNWGQQGFIWVRYKHFGTYCRHAYALMLAGGEPIDFEADMTTEPIESSQELRKLSGSFGFQLFSGEWFDNKPFFKPQPVRLQGNKYEVTNRKIGDQFQLIVKSDFDRGYIYVFSVDPSGKAEIHFPRSLDYNPKFVDENESALIMNGGSVLTIPTIESTLTISQQGTDHLVVLFSESRIKPRYVDLLSKELANARGDISRSLSRLIKKHMVPFADITYEQNNMGFQVSTRSQGKIVPIILAVETK